MEKKAHRGRLWKIFGKEQFLRGMCEYLHSKKAWARKILADAAQENQEETGSMAEKNLHSKKFWSNSKEVRIQIAVPDNAPCVQRNEAWQLGKH